MRRNRSNEESTNQQQSTGNTKQKSHLNLSRVTPMTPNQVRAFEEFFENESNLMLHGLPGTGKTFIALYLALNATIVKQQFLKVVIVRSAVPSRMIGFLPGDEKRKTAIFEAPYVDACTKLFGRGDAYTLLKNKGQVEFITTSFVRGTNIDNAVVIMDEIQNFNDMELHSVITRIGENCRLLMSGDMGQDDLTSERFKELSGLRKMMQIFENMNSIARIEFGVDDIVRSAFVKEYIIARDRYERAKPFDKLILSE